MDSVQNHSRRPPLFQFYLHFLASERYLELQQDHVWLTVSQWDKFAQFWFKQDGALPHNYIRQWSHDSFPGYVADPLTVQISLPAMWPLWLDQGRC